MGYPMTWQRVLRRNSFKEESGDINKAPLWWQINVNNNADIEPRYRADILAVRRERLQQYENKARMLADDLRRLELDGQDENSICKTIADRTTVAPDAVALVLKEFFSL